MHYRAKRYLGKVKRCFLKQVFWLRHFSGAFIEKLGYESAKEILHDYWPEKPFECYLATDRDYVCNYDCSIIVPVYNAEKYIKKCLESIDRQKTQYKIQVIIVNDGSTDSTDSILGEFCNKSNWMTICQSNRGLSAARNIGIAHSQGRYLMFVDADDMLVDYSIENMLKVAFSYQADLVVGGHSDVLPDGGTVIYGKKYEDAQISPLGTVTGHVWAKVFDRKLFAHLQFPEGYWYEDSIMAHIVFPMVTNAYTISNNVYTHVVNPDGIINQSLKTPRSIESLYVVDRLLEEKSKFGLLHTFQDFEQFIRAVRLIYSRTCICSAKVARCIFSVQCDIYSRYYSEFCCEKSNDLLLRALAERNYLKYLVSVWHGIWIY